MQYVDLSTGEIHTLIPYRQDQARRVRQTRPMWTQQKRQTKRSSFPLDAVLGKVLRELGPFLVLGTLAMVLIAHKW